MRWNKQRRRDERQARNENDKTTTEVTGDGSTVYLEEVPGAQEVNDARPRRGRGRGHGWVRVRKQSPRALSKCAFEAP